MFADLAVAVLVAQRVNSAVSAVTYLSFRHPRCTIAVGVARVAALTTTSVATLGVAVRLLSALPNDLEALLSDEEAVHARDCGFRFFWGGVTHEPCREIQSAVESEGLWA